MTRPLVISVLAAFFAVIAVPVHGYFQAHSFFNTWDRYREWFHDTKWLQDTHAQRTERGFRAVSGAPSTADKYPYPDETFVMSERRWQRSANEVIRGNPDWFDVEVIRQRAEIEEYPPAIDLLGWMYQEGRGLEQDLRKAYNLYERAKLVGKEEVSGSSALIFQRLTPPEQFFAQIQLFDDIKRLRPGAAPIIQGFNQVNLHIMKKNRGTNGSSTAKPRLVR